MVLMVFFSSRISPRTSTVILRERSPLATAVVTSAMLRTWAVRLPAMELTLSVRSFHVPADAPSPPPGRPACLPFPLRAPRASLPKRTR
jgi:tRNA A37 threonylcarbamoyladenosine synthetase subunit TsaC/SUA5/YrdC